MSRRVVIIGGGIAGLSAANALVRHATSVLLLEREAFAFCHSSGRNAAIFRPLEVSPAITELANRSLPLLDKLSNEAVLHHCPLVLAAQSGSSLESLRQRAVEMDVPHRELDPSELHREHPALRAGRCSYGLQLPTGGVLDIHAMGEALRRRAIEAGVSLKTNLRVRAIASNGRRVTGVELESGETLQASDVVLAAGAWSRQLATTCGAEVELVPHRRHLTQLAPPEAADPISAVYWDMETGAYFRKEGSGLLASPGDHTPHPAQEAQVDPAQLELLAQRLPEFAPGLADSKVQQVWACLRTMSPDRDMVLGASERIGGLFWFSGLAGHGMSAGLAAAQLLSDAFLDRSHPLLKPLRPDRFERGDSDESGMLIASSRTGSSNKGQP